MIKQPNTTSPHDKLLKKVFEIREFACAFIEDHMPWLWEQIKAEAERISETFVDEETLRALQCDIVLKMLIESPEALRIAFMIMEHKSYRDDKAPMQLLKYITAFLERYAADNPGELTNLPPVIPVLLYHGSEKWDMLECLDMAMGDGTRPVGLNMGIAPINLSEMPKEKLSSNIHLRGILYAMLYTCDALDDGPLGKDDLLDDVLSTLLVDGQPFADTVVMYIMATGKATQAEVDASLKRVKPELRGFIMESALVELKEEGRAEGIAEGKAEGEAKVIAQMLQHKFGSVPPSVQQRLEQAVPEELETWSVRIFDAKSPEAIFAD
ncbi:MAG: Rpn family recombination-promoting nuclease/putative transposase [Pseudomonadales bacterium]